MATEFVPGVVAHLRRVALRSADAPASDAELLTAFLASRDEEAFALLVHRHGPMVLGVCRRVLGNQADAEDACQATFLVFVCRAGSIRPPEAVGCWLHGVARNVARKGKVLWTKNGRGEPIDVFHAPDDRAEAEWVSQRLRELVRPTTWDQLAILYRTNAQSRQFEETFRRDRIPYQVVGAVGFYERKEVKDLLAYLKLVANPADDVSFRRVVNTPTRGIGDTTVTSLEEVANARGLPLLLASQLALEEGRVGPRATRPLREFLDLIDELSARAQGKSVAALIDGLIKRLDFESHLERTNPGQGAERMENVRALVSAAVEYEEETREEAEGSGLTGFLDRSALVSDADEIGRERGVTLMTAHLAKGLEFDAVFLPGLEENLFPHSRANVQNEDLEEERRLLYVAMTRAQAPLPLPRRVPPPAR